MRSKRLNTGKPRMDLLPLDLLVGLARVLEYGENKYPTQDGSQNYRLGAPAKEQIASLLRHLSEITTYYHSPSCMEGSLFDKESGLPHVDHIIFNAIALRLALENECDLERDPVNDLKGEQE